MITRSSSSSWLSAAWSVVDLPLPVGPTTITAPKGWATARVRVAAAASLIPSSSSETAAAPESMIRSVTFSPKRRRQDRDAQVDRAIAGAEREASVLRRALLGDVELRHHLQAARDRRLQDLRNRGELAHDAVDAGADEQALALGREVDVGRAELDRAAEDRVDLLDRGRVRGRLAQIDDGRRRLFLDVSTSSSKSSSPE